MQLSFIALSVIPELRITDGGMVDVDAFAFVPVERAGVAAASQTSGYGSQAGPGSGAPGATIDASIRP